MATIKIEYDGRYQHSYRATVVKHDETERRFDSGMPEHDFPAALRYAVNTGDAVLYKSSCDDFVRDGVNFGWKETPDGEVLYRLTDEEIRRYRSFR